MAKWIRRSLDDLPVDFIDGDRSSRYPTRDELKDEGFLFLSTKNVTEKGLRLDDLDFVSPSKFEEIKKGRLKPNDILITTRGSIGKVALFESPKYKTGLINAQLLILRVDDESLSTSFLYYTMKSSSFQKKLENYASGSAQPQIPVRDLKEIEIEVPPLTIQHRIADILGAFDDKIELNRRMNETLEEMAQTLYRHWFVDFGPFQDREFKDTEELGPIPKGWEVAPLETVVNIELDNIDPQDHPDEEFDYYSFSAYDEDQYPEIEVGGEIGSRKSLVKRRKVMVSRLNPGDYRIWTVYPDGERRGITSTEFIHFVPVRESLWGYLNCHLRSEGFKTEFRRHASGTTGSRQRVRRRTPNEFKTAIPPETVLNEFGKNVNPIWDLIHSNRKENQQLSETRDYLLPKLISGEIEVEAAEEAVEATG